MARGDIKWFAQALHDLGNKIHDLDGDDIRMGIVTNATVPAVSTAAPHWGGTGTTNFATNQVATGLSAGDTRWYWLRAVSAEGDVSALVGPVTATAL